MVISSVYNIFFGEGSKILREQKITREDFNYLNMSEIKGLAKEFKIPIYIHYENEKGLARKTSELESKVYLLDRLYLYFTEK